MSDGERLLEEIARDEDLSVTTLAPSDDSVSAVISEYPQRFVRHYSPPEALRRKALSIMHSLKPNPRPMRSHWVPSPVCAAAN
jgi:hypothetical protein